MVVVCIYRIALSSLEYICSIEPSGMHWTLYLIPHATSEIEQLDSDTIEYTTCWIHILLNGTILTLRSPTILLDLRCCDVFHQTGYAIVH